MTPLANIGPLSAKEMANSFTSIKVQDGAVMPVHSPQTLTSTVTARLTRPVTILRADIGLDSPWAESYNMVYQPITVPTGARVELPDTPTSGMTQLTPNPQI